MKKVMSCLLGACLVVSISNVAFASNPVKKKNFDTEKASVSKMEVSNDVVFVIENCQATDVFAMTEIIKISTVDVSTNFAIVPEKAYMRDRQVSHLTAYMKNLPKHYLLPNLKSTCRYSASMRC